VFVGGRTVTVLFVLGLVATVVATDILLFRHHFLARLLVNVGIVLVFVAFFLRFRNALGG
jgi:Ca2+/Na+ antiporter